MGLFGTGKPKILLAEDDVTTRALIAEVLESQDWEIELAENGVEALEMVKGKIFDLVILDHHMPGLEGIQVLKAMRNAGKSKEVPVIILTGNNTTGLMAESYDLKVADFVNKPCDMKELILKIKMVLESGPSKS